MNMMISDSQEKFSAEELRLLQGILTTDRKTIDFIENVVGGTDLTDRRASAGVLILKVRRLLDRELTEEMEQRKRGLEAQQAATAPPVEPGSSVLPFPSPGAASNVVPVPAEAAPAEPGAPADSAE